MAAALPLLPLAFGVGGAAAQLLMKPKTPKAPVATPVPTRNQAAEGAMARDRVSRRRGVAANLLLGAGGAESSAGGKTALGT